MTEKLSVNFNEDNNVLTSLSMDWGDAFSEEQTESTEVKANTPQDALIMSQVNLGYVDIEYMSQISGISCKEIIKSLKGAIYQNPETWDENYYKGWETANEYLSGNLRHKLIEATKANQKYNGNFALNITALEKILPKAISSKDIYVTLGSPWLPTDVIDEFIEYMFRADRKSLHYGFDGIKTIHDPITGVWEVPDKARCSYFTDSYVTYGTHKMGALHILEKSLNSQPAIVYDSVPSKTVPNKTKRYINRRETALAMEKQKYQNHVFQHWVWNNPDRKKRLEEIFDTKYASYLPRHYDGSFLTFEGLNPHFSLYPYQKDAVARILFSKNTLLAHDVGSGKTYIMASAGMELRRIGLSRKNLYVVPNNIVGQWYDIFRSLYPTARLLCVEPKNFTPTKRLDLLKTIRDNQYDGIIMAYSCFNMIPLSLSYKVNELKDSARKIGVEIKKGNRVSNSLKQKLRSIKDQLDKIKALESTDGKLIAFEDLDISYMFVDEAHNYKNVPVESSINNIYRRTETGSKKCKDMLDKVRYIQGKNNGGGVVMATGTPITNSLTDLFVMQKYLQGGVLSALDIGNYDSWIGMFAERQTEFEIDVDTSKYRLASRFSKFHNLPELTSMISMFADFHQMSLDNGLPDFKGYTDEIIPKSKGLNEYLKRISRRADEVKSGVIKSTEDNMLKITMDGRKAALDLRLVKSKTPFVFNEDSKVKRCADNVAKIYFDTADNRSTQLVFSDIGIPGNKFSVYNELKRLLIKRGLKAHEIAFVHDATTDKAREQLFADVRSGNIRVLIGSTFKLGMGVNVQDKLIAIHHLDVPWRPSDMHQREGRIIRQGNTNKEIMIYRYITEGSFDAYSWQLLETKQNFITTLLQGSMRKRSGSDVDDTVLNYGEIKALAIGNPKIKERVQIQNELTRCVMLKYKEEELKEFMGKRLADLPTLIADSSAQYNNALTDENTISLNPDTCSQADKKQLRADIYQGVTNNIMKEQERELTSYRGFKIVLPCYMLDDKPFIIIRGKGDYTLKLGEGERGIMTRLDNFFKDFNKMPKEYAHKVDLLVAEKNTMEEQIKKTNDYTGKIKTLRNKLIKIDKELGANRR